MRQVKQKNAARLFVSYINAMEKSIPTDLSHTRLESADVYRGFVMLLMMAEVLSFESVSEALPQSRFWSFLAFHQTHVEWVGCSLHDMIQPSFSFLVGVVLPYSIASSLSRGLSKNQMLVKALKRSVILILLGIFLRSMHAKQTYFTFEDTLTQIGLGYTFLFLLGFHSIRTQVISVAAILVGYWLAFAFYPLPDPAFDYAAAGTKPDWPYNLDGFAAHWNKNTNLSWAFDRWFLNLFPRESEFFYNYGGYQTLSFIPTLGTMILGLIAGTLLKSATYSRSIIRRFLFIGVSLVAASLLVQVLGINPIVKRIWTPAWTLFSGGLCFLFLTFFYWTIDLSGKKNWAFVLKVIGMNSIAAYVLADGFGGFISKSLYIHLGEHYDQIAGVAYATLIKGVLVLTIEWLILYWMYKRKLFLRI